MVNFSRSTTVSSVGSRQSTKRNHRVHAHKFHEHDDDDEEKKKGINEGNMNLWSNNNEHEDDAPRDMQEASDKFDGNVNELH